MVARTVAQYSESVPARAFGFAIQLVYLDCALPVDMTNKVKSITRSDHIEKSSFHLVVYGFLDTSAQSCVDSAQIGVYRDYESVWQLQRDTEDVLHTRLTTPTNTKRNCGGTSAKLRIWVGVYTALRMRGCKLGCRVYRKR
jgi:hypothetical protein